MTNACNVKIDGGAAHDSGSVKEEVLEGRYSAHLSIIVPAKKKERRSVDWVCVTVAKI